MDEWIGEDRFVPAECLPELKDQKETLIKSADGPMTRNQRRRFNDNGVPV